MVKLFTPDAVGFTLPCSIQGRILLGGCVVLGFFNSGVDNSNAWHGLFGQYPGLSYMAGEQQCTHSPLIPKAGSVQSLLLLRVGTSPFCSN